MKTFKNIEQLIKRLKKGICWSDLIKVANKVYKMVEYGDGISDSYMLFQNKTTTDIIEIRYQVPTTKWVNREKVLVKSYRFYSLEKYNNGELYRY